MKASELKIGNHLRYPKKNYFEITESDFKNDNFWYDIHDEIIEPIPITEDWLIRFGFEPKVMHFQKTGSHFYVYKRHTDNQLVYRTNNFTIELKFIHQLQNLYFALTGEELKLKDDEHKNQQKSL